MIRKFYDGEATHSGGDAPQPSIEDGKQEVPEEIEKWILDACNEYPGSAYALGWRRGCKALYRYLSGRYEMREAMAERAAQHLNHELQTKDMRLKYKQEEIGYRDEEIAALQSELSAYREALQEYAGTEMGTIAQKVLAKFENQ
jgi:hypothetical protein